MRARALWARTRIHVWPERYVLASLPMEQAAAAAALAGSRTQAFAALVVERDEVSLTLSEDAWRESELRLLARAEAGPFRAITFDIDVELDVCGYLAPAAQRLALAGVSIVPQCAYLKDHLLVHESRLTQALSVLEELIRACRSERIKRRSQARR